LAGEFSFSGTYNAMEGKKEPMFDIKSLTLQSVPLRSESFSGNQYAHRYHKALNKFKAVCFQGIISRLMSRVLNRPQKLYDLNALRPGLLLHGCSYSGIQVVPIRSIIGSEGRTTDFDMGFHPVDEAERQRWINVAMAYLSDQPLAPVQLIQVGDAYFVRDGHHRVSVSRAFGQIAIDAEVITWKASAPFPWQAEVSRKRPLFSKPVTYPLD
jgi:hypothetical protein